MSLAVTSTRQPAFVQEGGAARCEQQTAAGVVREATKVLRLRIR